MGNLSADYPHDENGNPATGLSVSQAAATLGLSVNAVRHKIRRGSLPAVKVNGEWRVQLVEGVPHRPAAQARTVAGEDSPADSPPDRPLAISMSAEQQLATLREGLVAPLVALTERQQQTIAEQAEMIGRLSAERDALAARSAVQERSGRAWWRRWLGLE
jgi:excisionase family DNA binding protein